jgi:hypothetical protein
MLSRGCCTAFSRLQSLQRVVCSFPQRQNWAQAATNRQTVWQCKAGKRRLLCGVQRAIFLQVKVAGNERWHAVTVAGKFKATVELHTAQYLSLSPVDVPTDALTRYCLARAGYPSSHSEYFSLAGYLQRGSVDIGLLDQHITTYKGHAPI